MQDIIPPQKKPEKKLKVVLIILVVIFVILAAVAVTYFLAKGKFNSNSNEEVLAPKETVEEDKEEEDVVYVTSKSGLNLRTDASTVSEIIYTMPYRGKIKLEKKSRDGKWYKGTYDSNYEDIAGWFSADYVQKDKPPDLTADWQEDEVNITFNYTLRIPADWRKKSIANSPYEIDLIPNEGGSFSEISIQVKDGTIDSEIVTLNDQNHNTAGDSMIVVDGITGRKIVTQRLNNTQVIYVKDVILLEKDGKLIRIEGPSDVEKDGDIFNLFIWELKFKNQEQKQEQNEEI